MGQKVHPVSFRLGVIRTWDSRWFSKHEFGDLLREDHEIRAVIEKKFDHAGISRIEIERAANRAKMTIHTARPGIIIGRKGSEIEGLRKTLEKLTNKQIAINIEEVKKPDLDAALVGKNVASQLLRRIAFRRAMKRSVMQAMKAGALGIKIECCGRLGGAEMARREWYREGRVPLHTIRADIDYAMTEAKTKYGVIGIKVWIFKGEILKKENPATLPGAA